MTMTILHNPRCSKSRETLQRLRDAGYRPHLRLYLDKPPQVDELRAIADKLGLHPLEFTRTKEPLFKQLNLSKDDQRSQAEWLKILSDNPKLIERPIVIRGDKAVVGRPPENVDALL